MTTLARVCTCSAAIPTTRWCSAGWRNPGLFPSRSVTDPSKQSNINWDRRLKVQGYLQLCHWNTWRCRSSQAFGEVLRYKSLHHVNHDAVVIEKIPMFFDVYIGKMCSLIGWHPLTAERLSLPISGDRFLLTDRNCLAQCGHNAFDLQNWTGPDFFRIPTR